MDFTRLRSWVQLAQSCHHSRLREKRRTLTSYAYSHRSWRHHLPSKLGTDLTRHLELRLQTRSESQVFTEVHQHSAALVLRDDVQLDSMVSTITLESVILTARQIRFELNSSSRRTRKTRF